MRSVGDLPDDYEQRVYAGVLGKIIGVYLGRPFEGWTYDRIMRELGEVTGYVNDRLDQPFNNHLLVVTDDDISGTLVFPRVLDDVRLDQPLEPQAVARTWLNELIPESHGLVVGRSGELDRAHRVPPATSRCRRATVRVGRAERSRGGRAGRRPDLLRGVRDDLSRRSRPGRPTWCSVPPA